MLTRFRSAVLLVLACCAPPLDLPEDADIECFSASECPAPLTCQLVVQRCIDPTIVDEEPPVLLGATASDITHVVLELSERIDASTNAPSNYVITPSLTIEAAEVAASLRQIRLTVPQQEPGRDYTIEVSALADISGNVMAANAVASFSGFGAAPDREPPQIIAPESGDVFSASSIALVWSRPAFAQEYVVEVAYDAAFTRTVPGFPQTVADPTTTVVAELTEPVRYYWRVRANSTRAGAYGTSTFDRVSDTLYVYCPEGATCVNDDAAGNVSAPLRTVPEAIARAQALGIQKLHIAARGGSASYERALVGSALAIRGGYTPSFDEAERDWQTHVTMLSSADGPALVALAGASSISVDGLFLRSAGGDAVHVLGGGVVLRSSDIAGANRGVLVESGDVSIWDNVIHNQRPESSHLVEVAYASVSLLRNTLTFESCGALCEPSAAIVVTGSTLTQINANTITYGGSSDGSIQVGIDLVQSAFEVTNNRITMGVGNGFGIRVAGSIEAGLIPLVTNNIVMAAQTQSTASSTAFAKTGSATVIVANNLFYGGSGLGPAEAVRDATTGDTQTSYVNNIMLTGPAPSRVCFYEDAAGPTHFRSNLLFECPTVLYRDTQAGNLTAIANVNSATAGSNATLADLATAGFASFPSDVHLTAITPQTVRRGGINSNGSTCGTSGVWTCGSVVKDFDGLFRTCPTPGTSCFSLGPYESDL